jgi:hypothetical protein
MCNDVFRDKFLETAVKYFRSSKMKYSDEDVIIDALCHYQVFCMNKPALEEVLKQVSAIIERMTKDLEEM